MKKMFALGCTFVAAICLTGCGSNDTEKVMTCKKEQTVSTGLKGEYTYEVSYKGKYVTVLKSTEKLVAEDSVKSTLPMYKEAVENVYKPYKDVDNYSAKVDVKDYVLTSIVEINYAKIDTDKLISIDKNNAQLIKNGKVKIDDIKSYYESSVVGATCGEIVFNT